MSFKLYKCALCVCAYHNACSMTSTILTLAVSKHLMLRCYQYENFLILIYEHRSDFTHKSTQFFRANGGDENIEKKTVTLKYFHMPTLAPTLPHCLSFWLQSKWEDINIANYWSIFQNECARIYENGTHNHQFSIRILLSKCLMFAIEWYIHTFTFSK